MYELSMGLAGAAPFLAGLVIAGVLITAVWWGIRIRSREPAPPRPDEQPRRPPEAGPPGEVLDHPESNELPRSDERLTPHQLKGHGNTAGRPEPPGR
ncbi:DUF6479 family protein [Streptomyces sp. NBC_00344]|uniref:DUF6479 family protein n=1 Tax=Streptomyces sp. NBC_00344 TaxID=2975720 RepID=UPI002E1C09B6